MFFFLFIVLALLWIHVSHEVIHVTVVFYTEIKYAMGMPRGCCEPIEFTESNEQTCNVIMMLLNLSMYVLYKTNYR